MDRVVSGYVGGLPGIHAMYAGADFRWCLPIGEGDRIIGESILLDLVEKPSAFARRAIQQTYRTTFRNRDGAVVCEADSWCFRTERDARVSAGSTEARSGRGTRRRRSNGSAGATGRRRSGAARRATGRRSWARACRGVQGTAHRDVGHRFVQGWGSLYVRAHGSPSICSSVIRRSHPERIRSPSPRARALGRAFARAVGVPGAYDYGPERVAWLGHLVTNWMGDRVSYAGSTSRSAATT